jgi:hypothetical protein
MYPATGDFALFVLGSERLQLFLASETSCTPRRDQPALLQVLRSTLQAQFSPK